MTTLAGSLVTYLQAAWSLSSPLGTANITFSEGWFNSLFPYTPQVSITDLASPAAQKFGTGGSVTVFYRPGFVANVWVQVPAGSSGTAEVQNASDMRREVARVFRVGLNSNYGGSLSPLKLVLPESDGVPRHELDKAPRCLRYELQLVAVKENE